MKSLILALSLVLGCSAFATNVEVYKFDDPAKEKTYKELIGELRCLVCQNQNIADSNSELATDMRRKTYELVNSGMDKREVSEFMAQRYGDFVLYKPPFKASTAILWVGPFILFVAAIWLMLRTIRARRVENEAAMLSENQLNEAAKLLNDDKAQ
jgi:cytochrome c-type biogenesis protein CcmH